MPAPEEDMDGYLFIDRDASHFTTVLTYLREGRVMARRAVDESTRGPLRRELQYYGLPDVAKLSTSALYPPLDV